jgi:hypothetical protein
MKIRIGQCGMQEYENWKWAVWDEGGGNRNWKWVVCRVRVRRRWKW